VIDGPRGIVGNQRRGVMSRRTTNIVKAALSALHYTGTDALLAPLTRGDGVILTLHQVTPEPRKPFDPNGILRVTPTFLDHCIRYVLNAGFDVVSLDEAHFRLVEGVRDKPFVCFTFDDGYRDNRDYAYPIFRQHRLPFSIYVPTDFADGDGQLWWLEFEKAIAAARQMEIVIDGTPRLFKCETTAEKIATFHEIYWWLRRVEESYARAEVRKMCAYAGVDPSDLCRDLIMTWDEIRSLVRDPLVTIGAHTRRHFALSKLSDAEARAEIEASVRRIEVELGRPCHHFSYPYGDEGSAGPREFRIAKELGLKTAVTTRKNMLFAGGAELTGLPRLSLNGEYQDVRYLKVLMNGLPFRLAAMAGKLRPRRAAA